MCYLPTVWKFCPVGKTKLVSVGMKESELGPSTIASVAAVSLIPGIDVVDVGRGVVGPVIAY